MGNMGTANKTNFLISEVTTQIKQSFERWYVGTSERDDVWRRREAEMVVFNVLDSDATQAAYQQLVKAGMKGKRPIGSIPNYLYLYSVDGMLPEGFIH